MKISSLRFKSSLGLLSAALVSMLAYQSIAIATAQESVASFDYELANANVLSDSRYGECLERAEVDLNNASIRINPDTEEREWHTSYYWFAKYEAKLAPSFSVEEIFVCSDMNVPVDTLLVHRFTHPELEDLLQALYLPDVPSDQKIEINGKLVSSACSTVRFQQKFMMARLEADVFAIVDIPTRQCGFMIGPVQEVLEKTSRKNSA